MIAVVGHILPIYVGFRGGKGVASLLGLVLAIHPAAALGAIVVFLVVLLLSKYVSLSSMLAGIAFPIILVAHFNVTAKPIIVFAVLASAALVYTHRKNINRLIKREEAKANLFGWLRRS